MRQDEHTCKFFQTFQTPETIRGPPREISTSPRRFAPGNISRCPRQPLFPNGYGIDTTSKTIASQNLSLPASLLRRQPQSQLVKRFGVLRPRRRSLVRPRGRSRSHPQAVARNHLVGRSTMQPPRPCRGRLRTHDLVPMPRHTVGSVCWPEMGMHGRPDPPDPSAPPMPSCLPGHHPSMPGTPGCGCRSRGLLPMAPCRACWDMGLGFALCPDRQEVVPVLRPAAACVSVARGRTVDYFLSVGTQSAAAEPIRKRLSTRPVVG